MERLVERLRKTGIFRAGILFVIALAAGIMLNTQQAAAAEIAEENFEMPQGSYLDDESGLTFTFTGVEKGTYPDDLRKGCIANVESYRAGAISSTGELRIPSTIKYKKNKDDKSDPGVDIRVGGVLRGVFNGCNSIEKLVLPETLTYIGQEAFSNCTGLKSIQMTDKDGNIVSYGGAPASTYLSVEEIEYRAFYGCTSLEGITLGEKSSTSGINSGTRTVQNEAFMNCSNLRSVEIRSTVNWIEGGAFANCSALDGLAAGIKVIDNPLFFEQNGILYFRESTKSNVLLLCPAGTQVGMLTEFPQNVTQIKKEAFYGCRGLASITIPDTVKTIGDKAFYDCIGLGNVTIPVSVTSIGAEVFKNCSSGLCIICTSGSTADRYAITNNITRSVECTVTFYNTETKQSVVKNVTSGGTVDPPVGWERDGYVLRWTDDFSSNTVVNANRTVSTVWKKLYTVTFRDRENGNESVVSGVEEGTEASAPNWRRKGYTLSWSSENYKRVNSDMTIDAIWLVSMTPGETTEPSSQYKKGDLVTIGNIIYKISGYNDKRVRVMSLVDEAVSTVTVPNTVSFGGRTYTVTCINANAFRSNQYLTKITLGTNIRSIEHYAFYNCSRLSKVVIKSKSLVNISNYAFKKTKTSLKVYVPTKGLIPTYRSLLLDGGMSRKAKVVKIP